MNSSMELLKQYQNNLTDAQRNQKVSTQEESLMQRITLMLMLRTTEQILALKQNPMIASQLPAYICINDEQTEPSHKIFESFEAIQQIRGTLLEYLSKEKQTLGEQSQYFKLWMWRLQASTLVSMTAWTAMIVPLVILASMNSQFVLAMTIIWLSTSAIPLIIAIIHSMTEKKNANVQNKITQADNATDTIEMIEKDLNEERAFNVSLSDPEELHHDIMVTVIEKKASYNQVKAYCLSKNSMFNEALSKKIDPPAPEQAPKGIVETIKTAFGF